MAHASSPLRDEVAAVAARLIAEDGVDYASAKRRALQEVTGSGRSAMGTDAMPDNATIEAAVRAYQQLFMGDEQAARLLSLRRTALDVMTALERFEPCVTGAVLNGTAGEHSDVHLQIANDNAKDVEIHLLNAGIDFDVTDGDRDGNETLRFAWPPRVRAGRASTQASETVHLTVVDPRQLRSRGGRGERASRAALEALVAASLDATNDDA